MDLIRDYALPLPTTIIAEMMGVPVDGPAQVPPLVERACHAAPTRWERS